MNKAKTRKDKCLVKQKFKCNHCKQTFKHDSVTELDHIIPKSCGGNDQSTNRCCIVTTTTLKPVMMEASIVRYNQDY